MLILRVKYRMDDSEGKLINITLAGDLSKSASLLIEKVSDALGGLLNPWQKKRVSKAEADAALTMAKADIEITDLQRRATIRRLAEDARDQENIENITKKAIPLLDESAKPQEMENDWIANFFNTCKIVTDDEMQSLWSRVLAGEANKPGSYSRRTVNALESLDKRDAELFTALCGFVITHNESPWLFIDNVDDPVYKSSNITIESLYHLDEIGLVNYGPGLGAERLHLMELSEYETIYYFKRSITLKFKGPNNNNLYVGFAKLTKIGKELAPICGAKPVKGFYDCIVKQWDSYVVPASSPQDT
jgi:hypothetical protein